MNQKKHLVVNKALISLAFFFIDVSVVSSRESVWGLRLTEFDQGFSLMPNYMYEDSYITVSGSCHSEQDDARVEFQWILLEIDCMEEMYKSRTKAIGGVFDLLSRATQDLIGNSSNSLQDNALDGRHSLNDSYHSSKNQTVTFRVQFSQKQQVSCEHTQLLRLKDESRSVYFEATGTEDAASKLSRGNFHVLRSIQRENTTSKISRRVAAAWNDGMYHFFISVKQVGNISFTADVIVEMRGQYGYLSAIEWPLLSIDGVMALLYLSAGTIWIFLWAKSQEHSRKIHIVIGAVAVAGAMGNTMVFIDLSVRNTDGVGVGSIQWLGKLISLLQLCLTQLLLMTVSTGYGINRPNLSRQQIQVMVLLSIMSFAVNSALSIVTSEYLKIKYEQPWLVTVVLILYSIITLVVSGWIMIFSIYTFIYLFQRRHSSRRKLLIFSVFMGCCITAFAVYIGVGAYALFLNGLFTDCLKDWKHEWLLSSVSQIEMFGLLVVLMWLWRPIDENKTGETYHPVSVDENQLDEISDEERIEKIGMENL